jgi:Ca2+-binding EF-hand superfamily protein
MRSALHSAKRLVSSQATYHLGSRSIVSAGYRSQKNRQGSHGKKREAAYTKQQKFWAGMEKNEKWTSVVAKFDKDKSGDLNADEVADVIIQFGYGTYDDNKFIPSKPTKKELEWIMRILQHESIPLYSLKLKFAVDVWHAYENVRGDLDECFRKFDLDKSGDIDGEELSLLLKELNDGHAPTVRVLTGWIDIHPRYWCG